MKHKLNSFIAGFCCSLAIFTAPAWADNDIDIVGRVKSKTANSIVVNSAGRAIKIVVTPMTKIEAEYHRGSHDYDRRISLHNIRNGEWVKVEAIPNKNSYLAKEIEVRR